MTLLISIDGQPVPTAGNTALIKVGIPQQVGGLDPDLGNVLDGTVNSIIKDGANRIIGGGFTGYDGLSSFGGHSVKLAKINDYGIDGDFRHFFKLTDTINAMIEYLDGYLVGGVFTDYDGTACNGLVYISTTGALLDSRSIGGINELGVAGGFIFYRGGTVIGRINPDKTTTLLSGGGNNLHCFDGFVYVEDFSNLFTKYNTDFVVQATRQSPSFITYSIVNMNGYLYVFDGAIRKLDANLLQLTTNSTTGGGSKLVAKDGYIYMMNVETPQVDVLDANLNSIANGSVENTGLLFNKYIPFFVQDGFIITNKGKRYEVVGATVVYKDQPYADFGISHFFLDFVSCQSYNNITGYNFVSLGGVATIDNEYGLVTKNVYGYNQAPGVKIGNDFYIVEQFRVIKIDVNNTVSVIAQLSSLAVNNAIVGVIGLDNDNIMVYGAWGGSINGVTKNNVAKINKNTGVVDTTRCATAPNNNVDGAIEVGDDLIFVGAFTAWNGTTGRNRIVAVNKSNGAVNTTNRPSFGTGFSGTISLRRQIPIVKDSDNNLYINLRQARAYQGGSNTRLHKILYGGLKDTTFATNVGTGATFQDNRLQVMEIVGSHLHIANTGTISGMSGQNLYRLNLDGTPAQIYKGFNNTVQAISLSDDGKKMLVGGLFTEYDGKPVSNLASIILSI